MSATASGSKATPDSDAKSRNHKQGNQERKYTIEQKTAVIRVRKCAQTSFYEILSLEKTASDGEIKKAYKKLSLLTHPDKNGYEGADEAFKSAYRSYTAVELF
jgi:DnaJ homolog subfamily B member 12